MESWQGKPINELLAAWGPPTSTYVLRNGNISYAYNRGEASAGLSAVCMKNFVADKSTGRIIAYGIRGCTL